MKINFYISKTTTIYTKHDHKQRKMLHEWRIMIWTFRYNITEYICTTLCCNQSLLWVILTYKAIWGYMFPEMIIRDLGIINIHVEWQPLVLPESGSWEMWKDMVTHEHLGKCVKSCLIDIQCAKCQNNIEMRQCKYCLSISLLFRRIRAWNMLNLHME